MMDSSKLCPGCGKPVPPAALDGLCPECLIKAGFNTGTEPGNPGPNSGFIPPPVEELKKLFPHLEILELIGKGGMGAVYKARQPALDRLVALKILPPGAADDAGFAERFNREARALARLSHPHIVAVHDFGQAGGQPYLVMEFVDGANLRQVEQAGRLAPEQALEIVPQICEALQFAHNEGVVHRDIKPENILLDKKGRVKITDFGIAKILGALPEKTGLTGAKDMLGTPHYMAPEQVEKPSTVDHRADIYSLGVVFYELLTGELPLGKFQPPSRKVHVDVRLDEVVLHALEKEPERRYQQASQVKTDVETIAAKGPQRPAVTPAKLEHGRWLIALRALIMCLAGVVFGSHVWPALGIPAVSWGIIGCVFVLWKSFGRGQSPEEDRAALKLANQAGLVHAIGILAVGLILAMFNSGLDQQWNAFLASLFGIGIGVSLFRLVKSWTSPSGRPPLPAVWASVALALLALGIIGMIGIYWGPSAGQESLRTSALSDSGGDVNDSVIPEVTERVLYSVAVQRPIKGEDLDSRRQLQVPAELEKAGEDRFFHWLAANGVDLMAFAHKRVWTLWASHRLAAASSELWEKDHFAGAQTALQSGAPGLSRMDPDIQQGFASYFLPTNTPLPLTLAFETRAGRVGLLQITGFTESPQGVKVRYKLAPQQR